MSFTLPGARWRSLLVNRLEMVSIVALGSAFTLWQIPARGKAALDVVPFGLALGYFCILAGRLVVGALRLPVERFGDIPSVILVGFLTLSTLLLGSVLAFPLSLPMDGLLIALGLIAGVVWVHPSGSQFPSSGLGLACLVLSLSAATLWSLEAIDPMVVTGNSIVVFRPWADSYTHACFIRILRDSYGIFSLEHFSMVGEPPPFYHYASLLVPALMWRTPTYLAYAAFMVPFGVALTGLAAFVMARSWWSPGAGLAATVGVLLIPDASNYGLSNPFLGYFWLNEIAPTSMYGIALLAVAWVLVFEGCRSGRPGLIAAGFIAAGLNIAFKAQLFVANALLIWVYPAFFLRGYSKRIRLGWLILSAVLFSVAVLIAEKVPEIPLIRLDGSGLKTYLSQVISNVPTRMHPLLLIDPTTSSIHDIFVGLFHLMFGTFGAFALAFPIMVVLLCRDNREPDRWSRVETALFPCLVVANYLIMAMGLAPDNRTHHMADELMHRPLVWAYFAVTGWTLGCSHEIILKSPLARIRPLRLLVGILVVTLLSVPFFLGKGVQAGPSWGKHLSSIRLPTGLVRCALFLRDQTPRNEVVQGSENDPFNVLSALAERPVYVADTWKSPTQTDARIIRRLEEMAEFRRLTDQAEIFSFAARRKISWYVLAPTSKVKWPTSLVIRPAFVAEGYRVYHFPR